MLPVQAIALGQRPSQAREDLGFVSQILRSGSSLPKICRRLPKICRALHQKTCVGAAVNRTAKSCSPRTKLIHCRLQLSVSGCSLHPIQPCLSSVQRRGLLVPFSSPTASGSSQGVHCQTARRHPLHNNLPSSHALWPVNALGFKLFNYHLRHLPCSTCFQRSKYRLPLRTTFKVWIHLSLTLNATFIGHLRPS
jgi:hypothetical protein